MATPPKPPKTPAATPAPRRSSRKASTAKPATSKSATTKSAAPRAATTKPKAATPAKSRAPARRKAAPSTLETVKTTASEALAKPASVARQAAAALPSVDRKTAWSIGAIALAVGAGLTAFFRFGRAGKASARNGQEGHVPTDLLDPQRNADDRAIADFRPNMDAVMTSAEPDALRPATGPAPTLASDRGTIAGQIGPRG